MTTTRKDLVKRVQQGDPKATRRDLIRRAQRGDLTGMRFAILVRLSDESRRRRHLKQRGVDDATAKAAPRFALDINNRDEQVKRCTARIEAAGGTVVHIYDEPHTSAWKRRKVTLDDGTVEWRVIRPVYKQALKDLVVGVVAETGVEFDGLMINDIDRLTRDNRDLEDAIDGVIHSRRPILDPSGALDLLTDQGRTNARVIVAFKSGQSADTSRRVSEKHQAMQLAGIPAQGPRPFGWNADGRTLHPVESKLLQDAVKVVLDGKTVGSVAARWNRAGIRTARGNVWRAETLKAMLRNPRMAGYRMITVRGDEDDSEEPRGAYPAIARDAAGNPVVGQWDRMIDPEVWERLTAIIGEKPGRGDGANTRVYLGTGTLRCGKDGCDQLLKGRKAAASAGKPPGWFSYVCAGKSDGGCGGIGIPGPDTDTALMELALAVYEREAAARKVTGMQPEAWSGEAELAAVREDMAAAKAARAARAISAERYYADLAVYEADEKRLMRDRNAHLKAASRHAEVPKTLRADWESGKLTLIEKRIYLERAFSAVVVASAKGRRNVPAMERLTPVPTT